MISPIPKLIKPENRHDRVNAFKINAPHLVIIFF